MTLPHCAVPVALIVLRNWFALQVTAEPLFRLTLTVVVAPEIVEVTPFVAVML